MFQVPTYLVALFGKYVCYAILALSIDLIWGYCGILSLGHGAFLALGVYIGARVIGGAKPADFDGNPKAQAALGISPRELTVLHALAEGRSNKEIAAQLNVSPNTVKTHVARLFEKLGATKRVDAINKARGLGIVP